ncbi:MarR family winged helix-turn-helix transcriptional regulator [Cupriavidus sp. L7L]|uniref:MarR family winged helix-turn-helix transcriptional regulator n=1 Tax=Cupriavidus sp. L7L TaxID=2546443 RepID=UPI00105685E7|nr:MarR family transcriptional regulator [Cupriavidus sp. L7L]TDF66785.1 MarR family transcriptional regulator [Cupriavidus sp. L7L]
MTKPDSTYDPSDAAVHNRLFFRLFQAGNTLDRQTSKSLGITTVQWSVLGALSRPQVAEGMSFSELTEYLVVSRQSLDGVLKRLEREKHVQRVADTVDRRAKKVVLTAKGREFWNGLQPRIYEFYRQALASFGFDDKVSLVHFLNQLNAGLAGVHMEAAPSAHAPEEPARSA